MTDTKKPPMGPAPVLKEFFGYLPVPYEGEEGLKGFMREITKLSAEEKLHLAQLAAKEMGLKAEQVSFPLS